MQTQSRPFSRRASGKKRFEDLSLDLFRDPRSAILHFQHHPVVRLAAADPNSGLFRRADGFQGVQDKVENQAVERLALAGELQRADEKGKPPADFEHLAGACLRLLAKTKAAERADPVQLARRIRGVLRE